MPTNAKQPENDSLRDCYAENAKMTHTFFEWRHKVLTRFFIGIGACLVGGSWLFNQPELKHLTFIAFLVAAMIATAAALMDQVNQRILNCCYETGRKLESELGIADGAFASLARDYLDPCSRKKISYRMILQTLYWVTAGLLFLAAVSVCGLSE